MPKQSRSKPPNWNALYQVAAPQGGYLSSAQAREAGYSPELVQYYVHEGRLDRVARGILRLTHFPPGDVEDLIPIWLWSNRVGVFSHETALALHDLSDVLPAISTLTVPATWIRRRLKSPRGIRLHFADLTATETAWKGPIPITSALRTVIDCVQSHVLPALIEQAIAQALRRGLFARAALDAAFQAAGIPIRMAAQ